MIITRIIGGLGNQMFQYAAACALAARKGTTVRLDITDFQGYPLHQGFELSRVFNVSADIAEREHIRAVLGWYANPRVLKLVRRRRLAWLRTKRLVLEPHSHYWPGINDVPDSCYIEGYWQSEKYFSDAAATIRREFTFVGDLNRANEACAARIISSNSVSLHVRRGDYASNPITLAKHGLLPIEYYRRAVHFIAERVENPQFFVFSDDTQWVKASLQLAYPCHYVDFNTGADSYMDMRLMSMCKHHIVANSSFSWWGAWLNPRTDKIVVAPQRWFVARDSGDLVPGDWIRL
jgi:hypothetical protein